MRFTTIIQAIDPSDGELKTWQGPTINEISWRLAQDYCKKNLPYCKVDGILHSIIDEEDSIEQVCHTDN